MTRSLWRILALALTVGGPGATASAFCGLYVAKADAKLFNHASKVVLIRDQGRTVITMASDYDGDPKAFALVVPVPSVLERKQINVATMDLVDHLDAYSAPRLVEYTDPDPCAPPPPPSGGRYSDAVEGGAAHGGATAGAPGVKVEATYAVGEYDILILSAKESDGLVTWLKQNGYKLPKGAAPILGSYVKRGMKFFVAKVNLERKAASGVPYLRPLQMAFESARFDLPIRLGTVNATAPQDLFIYALTRSGRVESTNYRTVKVETGAEIPEYVKAEFVPFYRAMFDRQVKKDDMSAVYLEYAWDLGWCDPCAADPISTTELKKLGVFWLGETAAPTAAPTAQRIGSVFLTRLHVRYDAKSFPEDLAFQVTADTNTFQGRYVLRHPFTGAAECEAARKYQQALPGRAEAQAKQLVALTGWEIEDVRRKMNLKTPVGAGDKKKAWVDDLWKD